MRPLFRNFSLESIVRSIRNFRAISIARWRKSSVNEACSKPSTIYTCPKCSKNIETNYDLWVSMLLVRRSITKAHASIAPKSDAMVISAIHNFDRLDDLPDFASLRDNDCNDRSGNLVDAMV